MLIKFLRCRSITALAMVLVLGMLIARIGVIDRLIWLCIILGAFAGTIFWRKAGRFACLLIAFAGLGGFLMTSAQVMPELPMQSEITIHGCVADEVVYQPEKERAMITVEGTELGKVRLYLSGDEDEVARLRVGDRIASTARIWLIVPEDVSRMLWRQGISACLFASEAEIESGSFSFGRVLSNVRGAIAGRIDLLFPRSAALVKALVLGDRTELEDGQRTNFSRAGVAHLLAVSGLHVSLIAGMLEWILRKLRIPGSIVFAVMLAALGMYAVLVGMRASVVRAVLMYAFSGFARRMGRPRDGLASMSAAAIVQLIANPLWLMDTGFILSYSAVAGILMISLPLTEGMKKRVRGKILRGVLGSLLVSYGAVVGTLPGVVAIYGWVASYSVLLNLIAIPLAIFGMYGCVAALAASLISQTAGIVIGFVPDILLKALDMLAAWAATLPGNAISLRPWTVSYIILFIMVVVIGSRYLHMSRKWTIAAIILIPAMLVTYEAGIRILSRTEVKIVFLDSGQADSAAIHAQGKLYFVDVGNEVTPADTYAAHNGGRIEAIFLSHPHSDHAGGLSSVLESVDVQRIYISSGWETCSQDEIVKQAMETARTAGVEIVVLNEGDVIQLSEEVDMKVVASKEFALEGDANEASMVLQLRYGSTSALFTGDLPIGSEMEDAPDIDILKVAHHGSGSATSMLFLYETTPTVSVISVGANSYGHPAEKLLERLEYAGGEVYRTDIHGDIEVSLLKDGYISVEPEREVNP